MSRGKKICVTCLEDYDMRIEMHEPEALIHQDRWPRHVIKEATEVKAKRDAK